MTRQTEDEEREVFRAPAFLSDMIQAGFLGNKTRAGFYKRQGSGDKKEFLVIDPATREYRPAQKVKLPALEMAKNL